MVRLGKRMRSTLAVLLALALSAPAVQADSPWRNGWSRNGPGPAGYENQRASRQDDDRRQYYQRDQGRDAQRGERLSPEERQQLRRDIKDAGRELYPGRR